MQVLQIIELIYIIFIMTESIGFQGYMWFVILNYAKTTGSCH